ncbi:unnamed protein product [Hydatigera taeniaeformis]|uniref:Uncharacterized protein n=1 Tax=Hydatigena taeniaeformis TaxID=6205 RepID=A0A0R3X658_HYDTA|nr:unnamed protein product [Hydatigera taeniaeformis]
MANAAVGELMLDDLPPDTYEVMTEAIEKNETTFYNLIYLTAWRKVQREFLAFITPPCIAAEESVSHSPTGEEGNSGSALHSAVLSLLVLCMAVTLVQTVA